MYIVHIVPELNRNSSLLTCVHVRIHVHSVTYLPQSHTYKQTQLKPGACIQARWTIYQYIILGGKVSMKWRKYMETYASM